MLQIFDVSDMKTPTLAHKEIIGTRGSSSSEALANHLAFNYYADKNLLALPMTVCEASSGGPSPGGMTFSGLMVYDVTAAPSGRCRTPHTSPGGYDSRACSNWWTQASSEVKRSIFMEDFVYSISDKRLKVNAVGNLATDLATIPLDD